MQPICDSPIRKQILERHLPLVRSIARKISSRETSAALVNYHDLVAEGTIGLARALRNYRPSSKATFSTYAYIRVQGAMRDSLRRADFVSALQRRRIKQAQEEDFVSYVSQKVAFNVQTAKAASQHEPLPDNLLAPVATPDQLLVEKEFVRVVWKTVKQLPDEERTVMACMYLTSPTQSIKQVATFLGKTESRVYQIHSKARLRLRAALTQSWVRDHLTA